MTSRLERLYVLLESGSSASTRRAAAEQLGNVQKLHPHELYTLLDRLRVYMHSESWECRVATGLAVEAILKNVPLWTPPCVLAEDCSTGGGIPSRKVPDRVQFSLETFAIETVLSVGPLLTSGQEVGVAEPGQDTEQQRILIHKQLGLDPSTQFGNSSEIVSAEDLTVEFPSTPVDESSSPHQNSNGDGKCKMGTANYTVVSEPDSSQCAHKQHRKRLQPDHGDDSEKVSASKKIKQAEIKPGAYTRPLSSYLSCENWQECVEWPLEGFCEMLLDDLSSCHWIIRHGAAIALRYTLVVHGSGAGKVLGLTKQQMEQQHVRRLEDIALRIIRVLLLDRFADYVGDQVIAPVRESAAQALVAVFHLISPDASTSTNSNVLPSSLHSTTRCSPGAKLSSSITDFCTSHESLPLRIISGGRSLIERLVALLVSLATFQGDQWQIRHAAQLTFKYLLPVRLEQQGRHLSVDEVNMNDHNVNARLVNTVLTGLDDSHDDVVAVAASTVCHCDDLLLNQHVHHQLISSERLQLLSCRLWRELLPALDDLMTCTPAVVQLLASMVTRNVDIPQCSVSGLVECLWPFLCHVSSSVRYAATQAMLALVKCRSVSEWKIDTVQSTLRLTMQCTLTENHQPTVKILGELWKCMLSRCPLATLLTCVCPLVASWLCMLMQPARVPYTSSLLFYPAPSQRGQQRIDRSPQLPPPSSASAAESAAAPVAALTTTYQAAYLGGPGVIAACSWDGGGDGDRLVVGARLSGCRLMGWLSPYIVQPMPGATYTEETSPISTYMALLASHLSSRSYLQRFVVGHIVAVWMQTCGEKREDELSAGSTDYNHSDCANTPTAVPSALIDKLLSCCSEQLCYDETAVMFARLQRDCRDYIAQLKHYKLNNSSLEQLESVRVLSFEQIDRLVGPVSDTLIEPQLPRLQVKVQRSLQERRVSVRSTSRQVSSDQACCSSRTQVATVCAVIASRSLPEKLTALVRPLIDCLKREPNEELQAVAAGCLVTLIQFVSHRHNNPVDKILRNLCSFVCCDPNFTPQVDGSCEQICGPAGSCSTNSGGLPPTPIHAENSQLCSIITWDKMQQAATDHAAARTSSANSTDSSSTVSSDLALLSSMTFTGSASKSADDDLMYVQRRGATMALVRMFGRSSCCPDSRPSHGPRAFASLSVDLVQRTLAVLDAPAEDFSPLNSHSEKQRRRETVQRLVNALQVVELLVPHLSDPLLQQVMSYLPHLRECLQHDYSGVRHMSSRCISALTRLKTHTTLAFFCQHILPMLEDPVSVNCRRGASECLACVLQCTSTSLSALSYLPLLTLPVLARMSDHDSSVRSLCAHLFGQLVQLMPLQQQQPRTDGDQEGMPQHLRLASERHRAFIERLMSPDAIADQPLTVRLRGAQLRPYQRRGVSWLQFLAQYRLHGILCDDMGLGKSLQTLCVLAATAAPPPDAHHSQTLSDSTPDSLSSVVLTANHLPSLIVCPPTLTGHWMFEVERFMEPGVLIPLQYFGLPSERRSLQHQLTNVNLVISSYDIVRNDLDFFSAVKWNYCVLDEGHMIRNGRTKLARAIKQLHACHRLILTGTPMQNSVLELWSLFDFLMPGFLGSERQFNARYSRPILLSRGARANSREEEAGALALESLHRQVLPFMLRRLKEDVLDDLPPKIMQDYRCRLSDIQRVLYEDFARSRAQTTLVAGIEQQQQQHPAGSSDKKTHTHVFQALQYLRKVCNHPKLVLTPEHPSYAAVMARIGHKSSALNSIEHSGKLTALHQLLIDLGMGGSAGSGQAEEQNISCSVPSVNRHRALIFCQLKSMLDIVEHDLLERHLPTVSYLRLDGSVPAGERHQLVQRFNSDVTCDLLLLTTQVGGLGLNLTGADTVIFVEHDWNPMKDLQAMDRVHRIGQKRVVNVYRLIAERTLEEKIMGLQKFKLMTANSVVTTDNSSLLTMGTAQLFDLFTLDDRSAGVSADSASRSRDHDSSHVKGVQAMLQALPELWDDHEYQREYDLSAFLHTLRS